MCLFIALASLVSEVAMDLLFKIHRYLIDIVVQY